MLKTILVGLDASRESDVALELAVRWAARHNAMVIGLGVVDEPGIRGSEEAWLGEVYFQKINESLSAELRHKVEACLERAAVRCAEAKVSFKELEDVGSPDASILQEAQRYDLILMGRRTHFRFGWQDQADDTLKKVLANSPRPVVVAPSELGSTTSDDVLVAYDGSLQSARSLADLRASGLANNSRVAVLSVGDDARKAAVCADRAVEYLLSHGIKAERRATAAGKPADLILQAVADGGFGLLVMGAYGQPSLREFFLGSVTRTVLRDCPIALFLSH